jgi:FMN-dependent NADH-azoreductase
MSKVLYIKANVKPAGQSRTFRISDRFMEVYKQYHPQDEIITIDLYKEGITFLSEEVVMSKGQVIEDRNHPIFKYAFQFLEADKFVFAEPFWNLNIPAILKAYIDYISVAGITFRYTEQGPVGVCTGKKAVNITTRGGEYSEGPGAAFEMGDRYLKTILGFLGITDYTTIAANKLDIIGQDVEAILAQAIKQAEDQAKNF